MGKIVMDLPFNSNWELEQPTAFPIEFFQAQEFVYLGHGSQAYVFATKDDRYILKLFRHPQYIHPWRTFLRDFLSHRKKLSPEQKIDFLFSGTKLAFEKAKDLTGLVYVHLNSTNGVLPVITLKDKMGRTSSVDLGRCRFAIQRRAEPFQKVFLHALKQKNKEEVQRLFRSFKELIGKRASRRILNSDSKVSTNFGYLDEKVIEWDFGSYQLDPTVSESEEIDRFTFSLHRFFHKKFPELAAIYEK